MKFYRLCVFVILCFLSNNISAQIMNDANKPPETDSSLIQNKNYFYNKESFFFAGATIGTPGGVTLNTGYYFKHFALKISGSYWRKDWYGAQGDLEFVFSNKGELIQGVSLVGGIFIAIPFSDAVTSLPPTQQNYIGVAYDAYYSGFYLQSGLGFGLRSYPPNLQLLFQFGYVFSL